MASGNDQDDPAGWPAPRNSWLTGPPPGGGGNAPRRVPPLHPGVSHRQADDADDSSLRARWTLALAVMGSVLLLGGTVLFWRHDDSVSAPPPLVLPGPWEPPVAAPTGPVLPGLSLSSSSPSPESIPVATRPSPAPTKAKPVTPTLSVSRAAVPATVNLAALGTRDWVHWGLSGPTSLNRKSGGTGEIRDLGGSGPRGRYDNNPQRFTWTGGTPTTSAGPTPTGLYVCQAGGGFTISAAASPTTRTLRFYAGVWAARGALTATLAGRTATASLENAQTNGTAVFVIRFRAPAGETLRVSWNVAVQHHPTCGNVDIQAATLS
ncbi:hypothetical protein [Paractinoplanes rishiriensis]|uniref:Uncharacterized protein n=1 Tax=Paractinoplanes rishiriensis TaxID=1050105 RepID=A0A919K921_9ACTN|nr:hypothetical protein [Actinoplanes rishiriensis]GIF01658.1 hypothetical protein Ari01nite_91220 [Actinoplanes rishiriensis]